ncbi:MAG: M50 family metallopeptidase, partial [Turicibacter sp.]
YLFLHISLFFHELGHYFISKFIGIMPVSVRVGTGRKLIEFNLWHTVFYVNLWPISGQCVLFHHTHSNSLQKKQWIIYMMGPLVNLISAVSVLAVAAQVSLPTASGLIFDELRGLFEIGLERLVAGTVSPFESSVTFLAFMSHPFISLWVFINVFLFIANLIPAHHSDGEILVKALFQMLRVPFPVYKYTVTLVNIFSFLMLLVIICPGAPIVEVVPQKRLIAYLLLITLFLIGDSIKENVKCRREVVGVKR